MQGQVKLGFTSLENEVTDMCLPLEGKIPEWLTGTLIRNGAAKFEVAGEPYKHWFDGLAMLHKFSFRNSQILYTNQFLRGKTYQAAQEKGGIVFPEFATIPQGSRWKTRYLYLTQQFTDNASVNVTKINDRYLALTETPPRVEFDPDTLNTLGRFQYDDFLIGHITTVHPHFDHERQEIINYITRFSLKSSYNIYKIKYGSSKREIIATIPVKRPSYMHNFSITPNYIILSEYPLFIKPFRLLISGKPLVDNMVWQPEHGTNFLVIERGTGSLLGIFQSEAIFAFHHINAFEKDEKLFLDIVAYSDPSIIRSLYLNNFNHNNFQLPTAELRRYQLNLRKKTVEFQLLSKDFAEFPRINYWVSNGQEYNYIYGLSDDHSQGFTNKLLKLKLSDLSTQSWYRDYHFPGEPVFVMAPQARREDEGVILSLVLNTKEKVSYLLMLDAITFTELARAQIPHPIPFGSHGQYFE